MTNAIGSVLALVLLMTGCGATPPTAPDAERLPTPPMMEGPAPNSAITRGTFMGAGSYSAQGAVTLTVANGSAVLEVAQGFRASSVPDPVVYVGSSTNPNVGTALRIGSYRSTGAQQFAFTLPSGAATRYVILWCDRFNVPVGFAELR